MAIRYVSSLASGSGDGTSVATAWTWAQASASYTVGDEIRIVGDGVHSFAAGVTFSKSGGSAGTRTYIVGANASGEVDGTRPVLRATAAITMLTATGLYIDVEYLDLDANGSATGFITDVGGYTRLANSICRNSTSGGIAVRVVEDCRITNNTGSVNQIGSSSGTTAVVRGCEIDGCKGIALRSVATIADTLIYDHSNTAGDVAAVYIDNQPCIHINGLVIDNCAQHGIYLDNNTWGAIANSLVTNCGAGRVGFTAAASNVFARLLNCAGYNNPGGNVTNLTTSRNFQALTGDPYTNRAGKVFTLNNTAGAGAACRAAGIPGTYPRGLTTGYRDIGVQHQDSGGGSTGSAVAGPRGIMTGGRL